MLLHEVISGDILGLIDVQSAADAPLWVYLDLIVITNSNHLFHIDLNLESLDLYEDVNILFHLQ